MRFLQQSLWAHAVLGFVATAYTPASTAQTDALAANGLLLLGANKTASSPSGCECTLETAEVRYEWSTLTDGEKIAYSDAVRCLQALPGLTNRTEVPGAISRYDDFVWTHINQTFSIHGTTNFLPWHRYFTWTFHQALVNECGFNGSQPYWNWGKSAFDPINSPYLDGSATSMGGNGVYEAHNCTEALPTGLNCIPPGVGGGCVETGPFTDMQVNLGPVAPTLAEPEVVVGLDGGAAYNPRCLKRDISPWVSSQWSTDENSTTLLTQNPDMYWFQTNMQGDFSTGFYGVHTAGHFTVGGDPGGDIFSSPGDPMFWLHHAQIDRTWWIWQNQDLAARANAISGTITLNNSPPSRNGTLEDNINAGVNSPDGGIMIGEAMSTLAGPFCYIYA